MLNPKICQKARLSRDARFDGKFFTAVKTTGIYCRPICPAIVSKEENVLYFPSAIAAANAGYRPCLRCRPDSAPGSPRWKGANTTLERAIKLIHHSTLHTNSLASLAKRLGISDRYLRQLFKNHLGVSPKKYILYQQCLFAKQLLHQSNLPITQIALASGFNSIRRFNDCFRKQLNLTPSQIRQSRQKKSNILQLKLYYRPPYHWSSMQNFFLQRFIPTLEWLDDQSYGRTFSWLGCTGYFTARHVENENRFHLTLELDDITHLQAIVYNIRRILDLDADIETIEHSLQEHCGSAITLKSGVRLPGTWDMFEAGVRAILGQQISVAAARKLVSQLVETLGSSIESPVSDNTPTMRVFPLPQAIVQSDLGFLKTPNSRKETLRCFAQHYLKHNNPNNAHEWLMLKGIGTWTIDYACLRGLSDPDIFLDSDLAIKKAVEKLMPHSNTKLAAPWRSYLTLQLWNQL